MAVPQLDITDKLISALQNNKILLSFEEARELLKNHTQANQSKLSLIIKQITLKHLANANTPSAKIFRDEHLFKSTKLQQEYLYQKAQHDTLGSEIAAKAIGETLQINVVVTSVYNDRSNTTWCLHLAAEDAPTIHLYNFEDVYWSNNTTFKNPCLFNAVTHELQELTRTTTHKTSLSSNSIFKYGSQEKENLKKQTLIAGAVAYAVKTQQSHIEKELTYLQEEMRIQELPEAEKEQMHKDYTLALQLAREKMPIVQDYGLITKDERGSGILLS